MNILQDVISNANEILKKNLMNNLEELEDELLDQNSSFIQFLIDEGYSPVSVSSLNPDLLEREFDNFTKRKYRFPEFLNFGEFKTWTTIPSKILNGEMFETSSPLLLPINRAPVAFIQNQKIKKRIQDILELITLKLMASVPNGLSRLTIIDKTGSGQNFSTLLQLNDKFTDGKIISDDFEIERELDELKHSITVVTNSITANGFNSIEDYNNNTDEIAQPYRFLLISNFPLGFNKKSVESLISILESGPKAGIFTFMSVSANLKHGLGQSVAGITLEEVLKHVIYFEFLDKPHEFIKQKLIKENIFLAGAPFPEEKEMKIMFNGLFKSSIEQLSESKASAYISLLNNKIMNTNLRPIIDIRKTIPQKLWTHNADSGMCTQFAKSGIENIFLSLGINQWGEDEGTHHGLIGGSTGSGKTVLLHDIILHGAMRHSPEDLKFWLLDYKEGTEFATYENFPYVEILSMESEIEFGQEVLRKAISIIKERGKLFKEKSVSNLKSYNRSCVETGEPKLSRIVIIIDEFQALFPRQPKITAKTNELIDQILRLGRSFGINLLLATQTLKGIDMDPQLMSNMPLRIGLKMDKKDVAKFFDENNNAPKSLSNPGEGIYNKHFGQSTANVHFQAYLALNDAVDEIKEMLINEIDFVYGDDFKKKLYDSRFVYSGDRPSNINKNIDYLSSQLEQMEFFIGEFAGLSKKHASFILRRDFAENIIMIGNNVSRAASLTVYIINQLQKYNTKFYFANFQKKYKDFFSKHVDVPQMDNLEHIDALNEIYQSFEYRKTLPESELELEPRICFINFFIESSLLFSSKDRLLNSKLETLILEGPELGIHIFIYSTAIKSLVNSGINRDLDKFKKKIGIPGSNIDYIKIFGEEGDNLEMSKSKNILLASNGENDLFKFKAYFHEELQEDFIDV